MSCVLSSWAVVGMLERKRPCQRIVPIQRQFSKQLFNGHELHVHHLSCLLLMIEMCHWNSRILTISFGAWVTLFMANHALYSTNHGCIDLYISSERL